MINRTALLKDLKALVKRLEKDLRERAEEGGEAPDIHPALIAEYEKAREAERTVRTFCTVLHDTGCRISEALALTPDRIDLAAKAIVFHTLKKRRQGVYRAVPVPGGKFDTLELMHAIRESTPSSILIFVLPFRAVTASIGTSPTQRKATSL